jgi:hypothetical protein
MLNLDLFTGRPTPGAPDKVKSWSVKYPYASGDYTLPMKDPFNLPAWLGSGPYCNYAHGSTRDNSTVKRLTNPAFSEPYRRTA